MHERGMLQRIDHPSLGSIIVPNSPLRLHGSDRVEPIPSPSLGQHNADVYGGWLGLGPERVTELKRAEAI
jgi:crotonobetainyl-CoA:carnitine CoA-transferase CaiB-like acyl-CoA transferase